MNRAKTSYRSRVFSFSMIVLTSFLVFGLLLSANLVIAQSQSPKAEQWKSVGGKIVFSGEHSFKTMWHLGGNNMYWKNDEDRIKTPATHPFDNEVRNDVIVKKGQITVRGPGNLGLFFRKGKGGTTSLTFAKSGKEFWTASLGRQDLLGSGNNWKWHDRFINDFDPSISNAGWVPANKTVTLDVWAASEHTRGTWFIGYSAPKVVEYEYWFFPREGGEVIKVSNPSEVSQLPCEGEYLEELKKRVSKLEPGIYILCTGGDDIEVDRRGNGDFEDALDLMEKRDFIKLDENGKVVTGENSKAVVYFNKRGTVTVNSLTNFSVGRFIVSDEGITAHTNMEVGKIDVEVDRKYKEIDFSVSTPTCIAGVRGTEFTMTHKESPMKTTIAVHSGKVEVKPTICSAPPMILYAGQRITIDENCFGKLEVFETDDSNEPGTINDKRDGDIPFGTTNFNEFSLKGNIYYLQSNTSRLPDFGAMSPVGSIYTKELNISNRSFTSGFPGVTNRFEWFGIRYTGTFQIQQGGQYSFRLSSDDGSKLWIDNQLIINNDGVHPNRSKSGTIHLNPGQHHIQVDYFQGPRTMVALQLFVTKPGKTEKIFSPKYSSNQTSGGMGKDITWDFETGRTNGWMKTGTAFNHQPTYGDNPTARRRGQPSKHIGNYWIGTYEKYQGHASQTPGSIQGDGPKGTLTSNVFTIPSGSLSFLVGGGSSFQTRVELLVSGKRVLHVSGRNTETMQRVKWNLNPWAGQQGQIRIVDNASGGWGHINADDFRFSHSTSPPPPVGSGWVEPPSVSGNVHHLFRNVPKQNSDNFKSNRYHPVRIATNIFDKTPYHMTKQYNGTVTVHGNQKVILSGNAAGTKSWFVDNFILFELSIPGRTNRFVIGVVDPVTYNGMGVPHIGPSGFTFSPGSLNLASQFPKGVPVNIRVSALDYGAFGRVTDVYLIVK